MKKILAGLFFLILLSACNNKAEPAKEQEVIGVNGDVYWEVSDTGRLAFMRHIGGGPDTLSAEAIIQFVNQRRPNIQLVYKKMSGDTVFVSIPDANYLTQQMGSTGPLIYFAEVVYDITEIPGIIYVDFDFEAGDHAAPGTLTRNSFKE